MLSVDNSGRGNCMYYAYSISLMYFLRAKNNETTSNKIFDLLQLDLTQKQALFSVLKNKAHLFTSQDIKNTIEPLLGPACRRLAALRCKNEFNEKPTESSCYVAIRRGVEQELIKALNGTNPRIKYLIDDLQNSEHGDNDLISGEIFRVNGVSTLIASYISGVALCIAKEFEKQWQEFESQQKAKEITMSEDDVKMQQYIILDNLLASTTVKLFNNNNHELLNKYIDYLNTDCGWAAEETLMALHRAVTGEHRIQNERQRFDFVFDTPIDLRVAYNGVCSSANNSFELVLNNLSGHHWVSLIPKQFINVALKPDEHAPSAKKEKAISSKRNRLLMESADEPPAKRHKKSFLEILPKPSQLKADKQHCKPVKRKKRHHRINTESASVKSNQSSDLLLIQKIKFSDDIDKAITSYLHELQTSIDAIAYSKQAKRVGNELLKHLNLSCAQYKISILVTPAAELLNLTLNFKKDCIKLLADAKPVLELYLPWKDSLNNLFLRMCNQVIRLVNNITKQLNAATAYSFFKLTKSESAQAIEQSIEMIDNFQPDYNTLSLTTHSVS